MCTLVLLRRPGHDWPLLLAANRDEMRDRPWTPPGRHWPDRPNVIAGRDDLAGGSWLGLNDDGVVAAILNRRGTLGPAPGLRSRGELVLDALDHADAREAADALTALDARAFRPFNMVIADDRDAFWLRALGPDGPASPEPRALPVGLSMLTAHDLGSPADPRARRYAPRFAAAPPPDPARGDWGAWEKLLASRETSAGAEGAMTIETPSGFGTTSSAMIALPDRGREDAPKPVFRFADGPPDSAPWRAISV